MIVLDVEETKAALPFDWLVAAIDEALASDYEAPLRHHHFMKNDGEDDSVLLLMPAWFRSGFGGAKLANVVPGNAERGLNAISSSYILFDRTTGQHLMLMDGGELTARRTAATTALAAKRLARVDSQTLLVIGAGRVGGTLPYAYRSVLPIEKVMIHNRNREKAEQLAKELECDGFEACVSDDVSAAVPEADIIAAATFSKTPVLQGAWLQPGQHVDLIGSFTPDVREADDDAIMRSRVFVDTEYALVESGDLVIPLESGVLKKEDLGGSLGGLCRGNLRGRQSDEEITLFKNVGFAIEDLAGAVLAYASVTGDAAKTQSGETR